MELRLGLRVFLLTFTLLIPHSLGALYNRTIDDQYGDWDTGSQVQYTPDRAWVQGSSCRATPSAQQAHNGTWHSVSCSGPPPFVPTGVVGAPSFTLSFSGTAIYIFTIAVQPTTAEANFTLDGVSRGGYKQTYNDISGGFQYDVPVFGVNNLTAGAHTLTVDLPDYTRVNQTTFVFDYAIYSTDATSSTNPSSTGSPSPTSSSDTASASSSGRKTNVGAIVGGVIGGVILLAVIVLAALFWFRRRKRVPDTETLEKSHVTPFQVPELIAPPPSAPESSSGPSVPPSEDPPSSEGLISPREKEIAALRDEVAQLRANQTQEQVASPSIQSSVGDSLMQQVTSLRAEVDQLRANQEMSLGDLPSYTESQSPPTTSVARSSGGPSTPGFVAL
ncbi:hypothetical protein NLI96_g7255 [Meripilus lineatus]|uniref:Mid2 domain-containing protein n=1 Tax=Meripilus lineatus TaxID=2056292 RepID=A0AAD5YD47_9APHY|nr:hypothetical protein NLI96_g7255 [Physisporinus lineatus]